MRSLLLFLVSVMLGLFPESAGRHAAISEPVANQHSLSSAWVVTRRVAAGVNGDAIVMSRTVDEPCVEWRNGSEQFYAPDNSVSQGQIVVAILDTGIDSAHEGLAGSVVAEVNLTNDQSADDINGHGTHVAGIIGATATNEAGTAGVAPGCKILNVKVANDDGVCHSTIVARGIMWATDNGAKVINISLEIREPSAYLERAVNYAWSRGALVVAAAGNDADSAPVYPAAYENCIAVSAVDSDGCPTPLSNSGSWVDVAAPGLNILSTLPHGCYGYRTGTSPAAAYVSGLAVLAFRRATDENGNGRINDEVRAAVESSCRRSLQSGMNHGLIGALSWLPG
jgi:thermitase